MQRIILKLSDSISGGISGSGAVQVTQTPITQPGSLQLRAMRRNYLWQTTNRQPAVSSFRGSQGLCGQVVVSDDRCPYDYFKLFLMTTFWIY